MSNPPGQDSPAAPSEAPADPRGHTVWATVSRPLGLGFTVTLGGVLCLLLVLAVSSLSTVVVYIVMGLFVALALDPLVRMLERHRMPRAWGIVTVYVVFAVLVIGLILLVVPLLIRQIVAFVNSVPELISHFQSGAVYAWVHESFGDGAEQLLGQVRQAMSDPTRIAAVGGGLLHVGISIGNGVSGMIIVLVLSLYFLASLETTKAALVRLVPARSRTTVASLTDQITASVGSYLGGMVVLALCNAVVVLIVFTVLGLPVPPVMAIAAFGITLIPLVGTVLFWFTGTLVALFASPVGALVFALIYLVYMQLEAYVLTPKVMNKSVSVPGALVVIGALVGGTLLGLLGALVAIPVTASILLIIKQVVIPAQDAKV